MIRFPEKTEREQELISELNPAYNKNDAKDDGNGNQRRKKKYYLKHKEICNERSKDWRAAHPDVVKQNRAKHYEKQKAVVQCGKSITLRSAKKHRLTKLHLNRMIDLDAAR